MTEGTQMDVSQMNKDVFITGGQDIGQVFSRNGRTTHVASADIYRGRIKPSDDTKFHTSAIWMKLDGGTDVYEVYDHIQADHFNSDRMYGFSTKNRTTNTSVVKLVRSAVGVDSWIMTNFVGEHKANPGGGSSLPLHDNWETVNISSTGVATFKGGTFEQSRAKADIGFIGDEIGKKLFVTNNLSAASPTWTQLVNAPQASRYRIATHPYSENIVSIATDVGVYISKDKGVSWHKRGNFPENNPLNIIMDKEMTEAIYVMTNQNIYYNDEGLTEWVEFNKGLPLMQNQDMRIAHYADGDSRLYVAKYGRGVWVSPLQSVLDANGNKPVVDFKVHGTSQSMVSVGGMVKLLDQSLNVTTLAWTIENGGDVITKGNEKEPTVTLNTPGYYKVTLMGTNSNGSVSKVKEQYLHVLPASVALTCIPNTTPVLNQNSGFDNIRIDNDFYDVTSLNSYVPTSKVFSLIAGKTYQFHTLDNGDDLNIKAWIDYNNDGDFDDSGEEIVASFTRVDKFNASFVPPLTAIKNTSLRMRVAGVESNGTDPTNCDNNSTDHQTVDFYATVANDINFVSSSTVLTPNSASLTTTYTGATNVIKGGFVYSRFNGDLNFENSFVVTHVGALTNNGMYTETLTGLDFNSTYYYKPYVIDDGGVHFGTIMNFVLPDYKIPLAESIIALHMDNNNWRLEGRVFPEGHTLTSVSIQHGETSYSIDVPIDISAESPNNNFDVEIPLVLAPTVNTYQFRVKLIVDGKVFYSEKLVFHPNQVHCTPTVNTSTWFKRFKEINLNGINHAEPAGDPPYENATSVIFPLNQGTDYTITATGSYSGWHNLTYKVYMDFNNDNDFDDDNELVGNQLPINSYITPISISIPSANIVTGKDIRMRIIGHEGTSNYCNAEVGNIKDFTVNIKPTNIPIKIFLQGTYSGTQMLDKLRTASPVLIPTVEPYAALGYTHVKGGGGETCDPSVFTVSDNNAIVDWVFVELRYKNDSTKVHNTRSGLIQKDGDIVDVDGVSPLNFRYAEPDQYFVVVKHRNHLGVMSAAKVSLSSTTAIYNFTTAQTQAYKPTGHPNEPLADLGSGVFGMHGSNVNGDGTVKMTGSTPTSNDYLKMLNTLGGSTNSMIGVYSLEDVNMDANIKMTGSTPLSNDYLRLINTLGGSTNSLLKTIN